MLYTIAHLQHGLVLLGIPSRRRRKSFQPQTSTDRQMTECRKLHFSSCHRFPGWIFGGRIFLGSGGFDGGLHEEEYKPGVTCRLESLGRSEAGMLEISGRSLPPAGSSMATLDLSSRYRRGEVNPNRHSGRKRANQSVISTVSAG